MQLINISYFNLYCKTRLKHRDSLNNSTNGDENMNSENINFTALSYLMFELTIPPSEINTS